MVRVHHGCVLQQVLLAAVPVDVHVNLSDARTQPCAREEVKPSLAIASSACRISQLVHHECSLQLAALPKMESVQTQLVVY